MSLAAPRRRGTTRSKAPEDATPPPETQAPRPGITTRPGNDKIHPAVNAGVVSTRRTSAQKAADDKKAAAARQRVAEDEADKIARVAAIEDKQRQQDVEYQDTVHHPVDPPRASRASQPPGEPDLGDEEREEMDIDPHADDDEDYQGDGDGEDEEEHDEDGSDVEEQVPRRKKKPSKKTRDDILLVRDTQDVTGTPVSSGHKRSRSMTSANDTVPKTKKKAKTGKTSGLTDGVKKSFKRGKVDEGAGEIVKYGGPAKDDDKEEGVERAQGGQKGLPKLEQYDGYQLEKPDDMREYVAGLLLELKDKNKVLHYREFESEEVKSGYCQSQPILYTYAAHLAYLKSLPAGIDYKSANVGALALAALAWERELGFWASGEYVGPTRSQSDHFSQDNWGDCVEERGDKMVKVHRATRPVPSLKLWTPEKWEDVNKLASKYIPADTNKGPGSKAAAKGRSASLASSDTESNGVEEEPAVIIID